ncbi:MAG: SMI1/KNR4 family protein [Oscillospiraceae bacterium]|nr:SMI1/KNR4 family protein [Oscillospiraceae bacterium]
MWDYQDICKLFQLTKPEPLPEEQIQQIQELFGTIPEALLAYYRLCGGCQSMNATQDALLTPDGRYLQYRMQNFEYEEYCAFYVENQCCWVWAIKKEDLTKANPAVYETQDDENWYQTSNSVSEFLISQAYVQRTFSFAYSCEEFYMITQEQADLLMKEFPHADADSKLYTGVKFLQPYGDTVIMLIKDDEEFSCLWSSKTEQHFDMITEQICGMLNLEFWE